MGLEDPFCFGPAVTKASLPRCFPPCSLLYCQWAVRSGVSLCLPLQCTMDREGRRDIPLSTFHHQRQRARAPVLREGSAAVSRATCTRQSTPPAASQTKPRDRRTHTRKTEGKQTPLCFVSIYRTYVVLSLSLSPTLTLSLSSQPAGPRRLMLCACLKCLPSFFSLSPRAWHTGIPHFDNHF